MPHWILWLRKMLNMNLRKKENKQKEMRKRKRKTKSHKRNFVSESEEKDGDVDKIWGNRSWNLKSLSRTLCMTDFYRLLESFLTNTFEDGMFALGGSPSGVPPPLLVAESALQCHCL